MVRHHPNKQVAKISSSLPSNNNNKQKDCSLLTEAELDRKITLATEGFTTNKFCELILTDRSRLSKENALIVCDYVIAMKREINPKLNTIRTTIQFLSELSRSVGIEKRFEDLIRDDVLLYL